MISRKSSHASVSRSHRIYGTQHSATIPRNEIEIIFIDNTNTSPSPRDTTRNTTRETAPKDQNRRDVPSVTLAKARDHYAGFAGDLLGVVLVIALLRDLILHRSPARPVILQKMITRE